MGNANPIASAAAGAGAKKQVNDVTSSAQEGLKTLTASKTDEQKAKEARQKDRAAAFADKKKEREERKKKLMNQMNAHKKG